MAANDLAQQYYRRALELDPDYAAAYDGLGGAIWNRGNADGEPFQPAEIRKSAQLTEKAVQLDPSLVQAHVGLAMFAMRYDFDWNRADRELRAALALSPFVGAELNYANLCLVLGKRQEADPPLSARAGPGLVEFPVGAERCAVPLGGRPVPGSARRSSQNCCPESH